LFSYHPTHVKNFLRTFANFAPTSVRRRPAQTVRRGGMRGPIRPRSTVARDPGP
jgi:hypothetical protein